jgi:hypothetical protein
MSRTLSCSWRTDKRRNVVPAGTVYDFGSLNLLYGHTYHTLLLISSQERSSGTDTDTT